MTKIHSICVYCSASSNLGAAYEKAAADMGENLAKQGKRTIYGGASVGLMGICANAALSNGGDVIGIIPQHILDREAKHNALTELHIVESMHERKQMMEDMSDGFIILPGGLGTLDEMFEILTWRQLGLHTKPVVIVNIEGYWSHIIAMIEHQIAEGFVPQSNRDFFRVVETVEESIDALESIAPIASDVSEKWR